MSIMQAIFKLLLILTLILGPAVHSYQVSHNHHVVSQLSDTRHSSEQYRAQCPVSECYGWLMADCGAQWGHWAGDVVVRVSGGELDIHE